MSETTAKIDPRALRDCCGSFATGVAVITTRTPEGAHGMTANAFMSVSLDPPLISISLARTSKMLEKVRAAQGYAVNILSRPMEAHAMHFAGRPDDSLASPFCTHGGMPVLKDAAAIMVADLEKEVEAGDHVLMIGQVTHLERDAAAEPLVFHGGRFGALAPGLPV